jgi:TatD DNase family protein
MRNVPARRDVASPPGRARLTEPNTLGLHDTHCHLDLYPDPPALIRRVEKARVYTVAVTNTPSVFPYLEKLVSGCRYLRPALGLHPELAMQRSGELPLFHEMLPRTRYVGEVGLDYVTAVEADRVVQRRVFAQVVAWCDALRDRIITVHSRRAADDVVDTFGERFHGRYILHWYSGSIRTLRRALANGAYVSVNTAMTSAQRSLALLHHVPPERVLLESDGPFVKVGRASADPLTGQNVLHGLATLWSVSDEEAHAVSRSNFESLLRGSASQ